MLFGQSSGLSDGAVDLARLSSAARNGDPLAVCGHEGAVYEESSAYMTPRAAGQLRTRPVAIVGVSDIAEHATSTLTAGGTAAIMPGYNLNRDDATLLWGQAANNLYRLNAAGTWDDLGAANSGAFTPFLVWVIDDNTALFIRSVATTVLLRAVWNGSSLAITTVLTGVSGFAGPGFDSIRMWDGTLFACEYGSSNGHVYRSADAGVTWASTGIEALLLPKHWHTTIKVGNRILAISGDQDAAASNAVLYSDADGVAGSWAFLPTHETFNRDFQPCDGWPIGDGDDRAVIGTELRFGIATLDAQTGKVVSLFEKDDTRSARNYWFSLWRYNGVWYALSTIFTGANEEKTLVIAVSTDLETWVIAHRLKTYTGTTALQAYFCGVQNGLMHVALKTGFTEPYATFTPTTPAMARAIMLDGATENLLDANNAGFDAAQGGKWLKNGSATMTRVTDIFHGAEGGTGASAMVYHDDGWASAVFTLAELTPGDVVCFRCRVYAVEPEVFYAALNTNKDATLRRNFGTFGTCPTGHWMDLVLPAVVIAAGEGTDENKVVCTITSGRVYPATTKETVFWVDSAMYSVRHGRWVPGATTAPADELTAVARAGRGATLILGLQLPFGTFAMRGPWEGTIAQATGTGAAEVWRVVDDEDATNFVTILYDADAMKFGIQRTIGGAAEAAVWQAAADVFHGPNAQVWMALSLSASAASLHLFNGRPVETIDDGAIAEVLNRRVRLSYGEGSAAPTMMATDLVACWWVPASLTAAQASAVIAGRWGELVDRPALGMVSVQP